MTIFIKVLKTIGFWLISTLIAILIGVSAQTQFVLNRLDQIGGNVSFQERLSTTLFDLQHLGSLYGLFIAIALGVAFLLSGLLFRFVKFGRPIIYTVAGSLAILVLLFSMKAAFFNIHMIAGARDFLGILFQVLAGGIAGYVFSRLTDNKKEAN